MQQDQRISQFAFTVAILVTALFAAPVVISDYIHAKQELSQARASYVAQETSK